MCEILRNFDVIDLAYFRSKVQVAHLGFGISMVDLLRICNKTLGSADIFKKYPVYIPYESDTLEFIKFINILTSSIHILGKASESFLKWAKS